MNYRNSEMKIDSFVSYLNDEKINLSPAFQRGHVWKQKDRKSLLKNVIAGKPIPAVFLYKEASGSKYSYNILDGKQRLESLILFIGNKREDLAIKRWDKYFFGESYKKNVDYEVELAEGSKSFADLDESAVRDFREYAIPTIEITLGDETGLDEVISLFVDINQQGAAVNRFDIVKAMNRNDALLKSVFQLIARREKRGQDVFYKMKGNEFTAILKKLKIVDSAAAPNSKVDRMWERLLEFIVFYRTKLHRKPVDILKSFIGGAKSTSQKLDSDEIRDLRNLFRFLNSAYKTNGLGQSRLATDQTYFYTMLTTLLNHASLSNLAETELRRKLVAVGDVLDGKTPPRKDLRATFKALELESKKQTTDASKRKDREMYFLSLLNAI
jgi:GGDEF domain-containing protein